MLIIYRYYYPLSYGLKKFPSELEKCHPLSSTKLCRAAIPAESVGAKWRDVIDAVSVPSSSTSGRVARWAAHPIIVAL